MLLFGLVARGLTCFVIVPRWERNLNVAPASDAYPLLAKSLLHNAEFGYADRGANPTTVRGPGFPAWLAIGLAVAGDHPSWLGFWGSLPGLLVGALLAAYLSQTAPPLVAVFAGIVAVAHPLAAFNAGRVMGDDFYAACGCGALCAWNAVRSSSARIDGRLLLCGTLIAIQLLTRATGVLTLGCLLADVLFSKPRRWRPFILVAMLAIVPALAWSVRTSRLEGRPVFVHSLAAYNFWFGEAVDRFGVEEGSGESRNKCLELIFEKGGIDPQRKPRFWYGTLTPEETAALEQRLSRAAIAEIVARPLSYAGRVLRGIVRFWIQGETSHRSLQYALSVLPFAALALCGGVLVFVRWREFDRLPRLLALLMASHNIFYAATLPMARMSVQVFPAVAVLAGIAVWWTWRQMTRKSAQLP